MATKKQTAVDEAATALAATDGMPAESADADNSPRLVDELIAMRRDAPLHENGPTTAEVHPEEVAHWLTAGWETDNDQD
jgi:hypothetical protein